MSRAYYFKKRTVVKPLLEKLATTIIYSYDNSIVVYYTFIIFQLCYSELYKLFAIVHILSIVKSSLLKTVCIRHSSIHPVGRRWTFSTSQVYLYSAMISSIKLLLL